MAIMQGSVKTCTNKLYYYYLCYYIAEEEEENKLLFDTYATEDKSLGRAVSLYHISSEKCDAISEELCEHDMIVHGTNTDSFSIQRVEARVEIGQASENGQVIRFLTPTEEQRSYILQVSLSIYTIVRVNPS